MSGLNGAAVIVGAYEHPGRRLDGYTLPRLYHEVVGGALADAGLTIADVDGFFCDGTTPGYGPVDMVEYLGISPTYTSMTEFGGATYVAQVGQAAAAIAAKKCRVAVIVLGGLPLQAGTGNASLGVDVGPVSAFENNGFRGGYGPVVDYAIAANRHMYEFGTTPEQLAAVKVAASRFAQFNEHAFIRDALAIDDVLGSPMISDPLHRMDCCVMTDGGGAVVVVAPEVADELGRRGAVLRGHGEAYRGAGTGIVDFTYTANRRSGELAYAESGLRPSDMQYLGLYDSFTITVLLALEDLGICERGASGPYAESGGLLGIDGRPPVNTDGGGLCNNHPGNRGGMTKLIEAVRQLRGESAPEVQVDDCQFALVSATGFRIASRHYSSTVILEQYS